MSQNTSRSVDSKSGPIKQTRQNWELAGGNSTNAITHAAVRPAGTFVNNDFLLQLKHLCDYMAAFVLLVVTAPLVLAALLATMIELRCNPIFCQRRIGAHGKPFSIYKIRTMAPDTEQLGFVTKTNDSRIGMVGRLLRESNIDELPQLLNILKGEMSFIGARPLSEVECAHVMRDLHFSNLNAGFIPQMLPGLVGLEQLSRREKLSYIARFALNYQYESEWALWSDMIILLRSILACKTLCLIVIANMTFLGAAVLACLLFF